jgi:sulfide:quinone oxidoreductase
MASPHDTSRTDTSGNRSDVHHRVLILGGGSGGISVAARLRRGDASLNIGLIEPSETHDYQPLWTLVGAGVFSRDVARRREADLVPRNVNWIRERVAAIDPEAKVVTSSGGQRVSYDFLVVALGIQINWNAIPGLAEGLGSHGICSNYSFESAPYTWECIRSFRGGTALFTMPATAVKCGGAPQKIMYLADDHFRKAGVRDRSQVIFATPQKAIFSVDKYRRTLEKVVQRKGIEPMFRHNLIELRPDAKEAVFENVDTHEHVTVAYDMVHVTPPMGPPDVVSKSGLANEGGWVEVDKHSLQSGRFPNVFAIGDCAGLPTSKTGAAIRKQAPVLVEHLLAAMRGTTATASYNGYSSCPVVTGYGKMMLAEFDYNQQPAESFPFDQSKERYSMWLLKTQLLPRLYWYGMLRGRL